MVLRVSNVYTHKLSADALRRNGIYTFIKVGNRLVAIEENIPVRVGDSVTLEYYVDKPLYLQVYSMQMGRKPVKDKRRFTQRVYPLSDAELRRGYFEVYSFVHI